MLEKILKFIEAGKKGGAKCVAGGERLGKNGYFIQPTVFADVLDDMKIAKEEVNCRILELRSDLKYACSVSQITLSW